MPASIHPPVQLHIVLDEESYQGGDSVEMARRFTAVAPTEVVRASKGSQRANVLRFDVGDDAVATEAETDSLWRDALTTWLDEEFDETSALVARENNARENNGERAVLFTWTEVKFGTGPVVAIRMRDSSIPAEAAGFVARARELAVSGAFGADPIASIRIPACVSIEAQRSAAQTGDSTGAGDDDQARRLREIGLEERGSSSAMDVVEALIDAAGLDDKGAGEAASDPDNQNAWAATEVEHDAPSRSELDAALAEAEAALRHGDDPTDVDAEERDAASSDMVASVRTDVPAVHVKVDESRADGEHDRDDEGIDGAGNGDTRPDGAGYARSPREADLSGESCALANEDVPDSLDYRIWNVAYADGTSVRFDSVLGEALID